MIYILETTGKLVKLNIKSLEKTEFDIAQPLSLLIDREKIFVGTAEGILLVTDLNLKKLHKVQAGTGRLKKIVTVTDDIYASIFASKSLKVFAYEDGVLDLGEQLISQLPVDLIAVDAGQKAEDEEPLDALEELEEEFEDEYLEEGEDEEQDDDKK